ncbi:MAG: PAS domain S-box protein [Prosthecobacter sp.]
MRSATALTVSSTPAGDRPVPPPGEGQEPGRVVDERFRQAFAKAAVGFAIAAPDGTILHVNERFCHITGRTEGEMVGGTFAALTHPDDMARKVELNQQLLAGEIDDYIVEKRYVRKDGSVAWVENSVSAIRDDQGMAVNVLVLCKDITARQEAEERLHWTNHRFEQQREALSALLRGGGVLQAEDLTTALQTITRMTAHVLEVERVSVWRLRPQHDAIVCLQLHERRAGQDSSGLELHADDFPSYFKALGGQEIIADDAREDPRTREFRDSYLDPLGITSMLDAPIHLNGTLAGVLCLEHVGAARHWQADEQSFAVSTANLVSLVLAQWERRRIEETLRQQASLLDKAQDAILVRDLKHTVTYWNKGAERLYGWTAEEALGSNVVELFYPDDKPFAQALHTVLLKNEWTGELVQRNKTGQEVTVEARWTLVRDAAGKPASILSINTDITAKKRLEEQFLRAQRMESIGTLAGGIAHDLNNVLTPILMSIDLLRLRLHDAVAQRTLSTIETSAKRGASMIQQVLSFSKGVDGSKLPVFLHKVLQDISTIIRDTFPKNIQVGLQTSPDLWSIHGDATQIHQMLLNLCVNARDAMPAGGILSIEAHNVMIDAQFAATQIEMREGPHVVITVEDSGGGIERDIIGKIFDPFFTTQKAGTGAGTGLGLSTALAIVKSHGGFIRVSSEPGAGSRFSVHLPAEITHEESTEAAPDVPPVPRGNNELVLVVDDESAVREITRQTLETFGYRVLIASDGAEAVALYAMQHEKIDVVLTDMMMPVMDGVATIQVLKKINPNARIIAASGVTTNGGPARAAEAGVTCFLPKPYTAETILRALHQILG